MSLRHRILNGLRNALDFLDALGDELMPSPTDTKPSERTTSPAGTPAPRTESEALPEPSPAPPRPSSLPGSPGPLSSSGAHESHDERDPTRSPQDYSSSPNLPSSQRSMTSFQKTLKPPPDLLESNELPKAPLSDPIEEAYHASIRFSESWRSIPSLGDALRLPLLSASQEKRRKEIRSIREAGLYTLHSELQYLVLSPAVRTGDTRPTLLPSTVTRPELPDILQSNELPTVPLCDPIEEAYHAEIFFNGMWRPDRTPLLVDTLRELLHDAPLGSKCRFIRGAREAGLYSLYSALQDLMSEPATSTEDAGSTLPPETYRPSQSTKDSELMSPGTAASIDDSGPFLEPEIYRRSQHRRPFRGRGILKNASSQRSQRPRLSSVLDSLDDDMDSDSSQESPGRTPRAISPPNITIDPAADVMKASFDLVKQASRRLQRRVDELPDEPETSPSGNMSDKVQTPSSSTSFHHSTKEDDASIYTTSSSSSERRRLVNIKRSASGSSWGPTAGAKSSASTSYSADSEEPRGRGRQPTRSEREEVRDRLRAQAEYFKEIATAGPSKRPGHERSLSKVASDAKRASQRSPASRRTGLPPELKMTSINTSDKGKGKEPRRDSGESSIEGEAHDENARPQPHVKESGAASEQDSRSASTDTRVASPPSVASNLPALSRRAHERRASVRLSAEEAEKVADCEVPSV